MAETLDIAKLGRRVRSLRQKRGFSLQELSGRASVSVSMLSAVERGGKVASIQTLHQIAMALKISVARLIETEALPQLVALRSDEQTVMTNGSGWARRVLSPSLPGFEFEMTRSVIEPGVEAGELRLSGVDPEGFWLLKKGILTMILDGKILQFYAGDSASYAGESRLVLRNDSEVPCIYYHCMNLEPTLI